MCDFQGRHSTHHDCLSEEGYIPRLSVNFSQCGTCFFLCVNTGAWWVYHLHEYVPYTVAPASAAGIIAAIYEYLSFFFILTQFHEWICSCGRW